jgi:hypothetical protein
MLWGIPIDPEGVEQKDSALLTIDIHIFAFF